MEEKNFKVWLDSVTIALKENDAINSSIPGELKISASVHAGRVTKIKQWCNS